MEQQITVNFIENPFRPVESREISQHDPGLSFRQLFFKVNEKKIGLEFVVSDSKGFVEEDRYDDVVPQGETIIFCPIPEGGGSGKNIFRIIAMIAIIVISAYTGNIWGAGFAQGFTNVTGVAMTAQTGAMIVSTMTMMAGSLLINTLLPVNIDPIGGFGNNFQDSPTYGWNVSENPNGEGTIWPVVYGDVVVTPPLIAKYVEIKGDKQYLNLLYGVADHQIDGVDINKFFVNGSAASLNTETECDYRFGTTNQSPIQYFNDTRTVKLSGQKISGDWSNIVQTDGNSVQGLGIAITLPRGLCYANNAGGLSQQTVTLEIAYKPTSSDTWKYIGTPKYTSTNVLVYRWSAGYWNSIAQWIELEEGTTSATAHRAGDVYYPANPVDPIGNWRPIYQWRWISTGVYQTVTSFTTSSVTITGSTTQPIRRVFYADHLTPATRYDVRVRFNPAAPTGVRYSNDTYLEYIEEIIYDDLEYPGTALFAVRALATDKLSGGIPQVQIGVSRDYIQAWTGSTHVPKPANNPAWAAYDLLHNGEYGGGVPGHRLNYDSFCEWATFCSNENFTCNIYFDSAVNINKGLMILSNLGRGFVAQLGSTFHCFIEREEPLPAQKFMFTMGNIEENSYEEEWLDIDDRANVVEVAWFDNENKNTRQVVEIPAFDYETTDREIKRTQLVLLGCTDRAMAIRHGRYAMNCNRLITLTASWKAGVDSIGCFPYDVVEVSHDVPQYGYSGRVVDSDVLTITLDRPVVMEPGKSYVIDYQKNDDVRYTKACSAVATVTTTSTITMAAVMATPPEKFDIYAFGEVNKATKLFRVLRISRYDDLTRKIYAAEYNPDIYNDTGATIDAPPIVSDLSTAQFLRAEEVWRGGSSTVVQLCWLGFASLWHVKYRLTGETEWKELGRVREQFFIVPGIDYGIEYEFNVSHTPDPDLGRTTSITLVGKLYPPSNITTLNSHSYEDTVMFYWLPVGDFDLKGYLVKTAVKWAAGVQYSAGMYVTPETYAERIYKSLNAGKSGTSEPSFPSGTAATITDNEVVWEEASADWDEIFTSTPYYTRTLTKEEKKTQGYGFSRISIWAKGVDAFELESETTATHTGTCLNWKPGPTIGPFEGQGHYTNFQDAFDALPDEGGAIYIKNGNYTNISIELPNKNIDIIGESRNGVILRNVPGKSLFYSDQFSNRLNMESLTIQSSNYGTVTSSFLKSAVNMAEKGTYLRVEKLTETELIACYSDTSSNIKVIAGHINSSGVLTLGSAVDTGGDGTVSRICRLNDTTFVIVYAHTGDSSHGYAHVCTTSGANNTTISVGDASEFENAAVSYPDVIRLDDSKLVVVWTNATKSRARCATVSGTSFTWGTVVDIYSTQAPSTGAWPISNVGASPVSDSVFYVHIATNGGGAKEYSRRFVRCTVATRTITAGTVNSPVETGAGFDMSGFCAFEDGCWMFGQSSHDYTNKINTITINSGIFGAPYSAATSVWVSYLNGRFKGDSYNTVLSRSKLDVKKIDERKVLFSSAGGQTDKFCYLFFLERAGTNLLATTRYDVGTALGVDVTEGRIAILSEGYGVFYWTDGTNTKFSIMDFAQTLPYSSMINIGDVPGSVRFGNVKALLRDVDEITHSSPIRAHGDSFCSLGRSTTSTGELFVDHVSVEGGSHAFQTGTGFSNVSAGNGCVFKNQYEISLHCLDGDFSVSDCSFLTQVKTAVYYVNLTKMAQCRVINNYFELQTEAYVREYPIVTGGSTGELAYALDLVVISGDLVGAVVADNNVRMTNATGNTAGVERFCGFYLYGFYRGGVEGNSIYIDVPDGAQGIYGVTSYLMIESHFSNNSIVLNNNHSLSPWAVGFWMWFSDRNALNGNVINTTDNATYNHGFYLYDCDNNYGVGNITNLVGTSVKTDAGAPGKGNSITTKDI